MVATTGTTAIYLRQVAEIEFAPKFRRETQATWKTRRRRLGGEAAGIDTVVLTREIEQSLKEIAGASQPE